MLKAITFSFIFPLNSRLSICKAMSHEWNFPSLKKQQQKQLKYLLTNILNEPSNDSHLLISPSKERKQHPSSQRK